MSPLIIQNKEQNIFRVIWDLRYFNIKLTVTKHVKVTTFKFKRSEVQTYLFPVIYIFDSLESLALWHQWIQSFKDPSFLEPILTQNGPFHKMGYLWKKQQHGFHVLPFFNLAKFLWFSWSCFLSLCKILKKIIRANPVLQGSVNFSRKLGPEWSFFLEQEFLGKSNIYLFYLEYPDYLILINQLHLDKLKFLFHFK